ncbi:MAG: hypothetical protein HYU86_01595 [Chloroflexi bacterium]|nr:hypothetical protein [Chloroflexota bacterium]
MEKAVLNQLRREAVDALEGLPREQAKLLFQKVEEGLRHFLGQESEDLRKLMVIEGDTNGAQLKSIVDYVEFLASRGIAWPFLTLLLRLRKLHEEWEATLDVQRDEELMQQLRQAEKDLKLGRRDNFIPWEKK